MNKGVRLYKKALKLAQKGESDLKQIFTLLTESDELGCIDASYALATWYLFGKFVGKNFKKAVIYLAKASEFNHPHACFDLAICYETGKGVKRNKMEAFRLYLKAALLGERQSLYEVGRCFYYGIGIEKNQEVANVWLEEAERHGIT